MDRRLVLGLLALVVVALVGLGGLIASDTSDGGHPTASAHPPRIAAAPRAERVRLPPPRGVSVPAEPPPSDQPPPTHLTPEERQTMNVAVEDVLKVARDECLKPWLATLDDPDESEFVFDAVTYDGKVVDIGIRSLQHDIPADVMSCVDDKAWSSDWPEWDTQGELRLQRHIAIAGARRYPDAHPEVPEPDEEPQ